MVKYIKKAIPIEAEQLIKKTTVETLEGTMQGNIDDYLVTGIHGEKYIVKQKIFEETYDIWADNDKVGTIVWEDRLFCDCCENQFKLEDRIYAYFDYDTVVSLCHMSGDCPKEEEK